MGCLFSSYCVKCGIDYKTYQSLSPPRELNLPIRQHCRHHGMTVLNSNNIPVCRDCRCDIRMNINCYHKWSENIFC